MQRCYFAIDDGEYQSRDGEGQEFTDAEAGRWKAIGVLSDTARSVLPDGDRRSIVIMKVVAGMLILTVTLSLVAQWAA